MFDGQQQQQRGAKQSMNAKTAGYSRRANEGVEIRKSKAQGTLEKKRRQQSDNNLGDMDTSSLASTLTGPIDDPWSYNISSPTTSVPVGLLPNFVQLVNSSSIQDVHQGVMLIRKLLSVKEQAPIDQIVQSNVTPILIQCMMQTENPALQFEASWALSNIAAGSKDDTLHVLQTNAVPIWVQHFSSQDPDLVEQAAWAIGNIAGGGLDCREYCVNSGALAAVLAVITGPLAEQHLPIMQNCVWALSNLCRFKPSLHIDAVTEAIPIALQLITSANADLAFDALWVVALISDGGEQYVDTILDFSGALQSIVGMLSSQHPFCHLPALRTIGNILCGTTFQMQAAIQAGALEKIKLLLGARSSRIVRKEAMWTLANIAEAPPTHIDHLANSEMFPIIIEHMSARETELAKEAIWAASNIAAHGSPQHLHHLVECGLLGKLSGALRGCMATESSVDVNLVVAILESVVTILEMGDVFAAEGSCANAYIDMLKEQGCDSIIESISETTRDDEIYTIAHHIVTAFFGGGAGARGGGGGGASGMTTSGSTSNLADMGNNSNGNVVNNNPDNGVFDF